MSDVSNKPVFFYERRFYPLSNFSSFMVDEYPTAEHAYQVEKFLDPGIRVVISRARSAHEAKRIAQHYKLFVRKDWDENKKLEVMEDVCRRKLEQHPYIQQVLLETLHREIIEDSPTDLFWGWGPNKKGLNYLGKIWMKLRGELQQKRAA